VRWCLLAAASLLVLFLLPVVALVHEIDFHRSDLPGLRPDATSGRLASGSRMRSTPESAYSDLGIPGSVDIAARCVRLEFVMARVTSAARRKK